MKHLIPFLLGIVVGAVLMHYSYQYRLNGELDTSLGGLTEMHEVILESAQKPEATIESAEQEEPAPMKRAVEADSSMR